MLQRGTRELLADDGTLEHPHPVIGVKTLGGVAWTASRSPMVAATAAPCRGQHTREVLARWLGLDADDRLVRRRALTVLPSSS